MQFGMNPGGARAGPARRRNRRRPPRRRRVGRPTPVPRPGSGLKFQTFSLSVYLKFPNRTAHGHATRPEMPTDLGHRVAAIRVLGIQTLQLPHPARQISVRRLDQRMVVMAHLTKSMSHPKTSSQSTRSSSFGKIPSLRLALGVT